MVAEWDGEVVGFASVSPYKERAAYRTTVEDSVYVRRDRHGLGIGKALLLALLDAAEASGFHAVMARIEAGGTASARCTRRAASASSGSSGRWAGSSTAGSTPPSCSAFCGSGPAEGNRQGAGVDGAGSIQRSCQTSRRSAARSTVGSMSGAAGRPFSET